MPKDPDKIREQMDRLQGELKEAEQHKRDKNQKKISRAAERSGLDKLKLTTRELESQFKEIAKQKRAAEAEKTAQDKPTNDQTGKQNETSVNTETAQTTSRPVDSSTHKNPVDSQEQAESKEGERPPNEHQRRNPFRR